MSHLTENEQQFIRDFLKLMPDDGVQALMSTVTRRMVKPDSRRACIDAIILHSASLDEFLKRQKVTKENLFRYLNERKISVPNTDKAALEIQIKDLVSGGALINHVPAHRNPAKLEGAPPSPWAVPEHLSSSGPNVPMPLLTNHHFSEQNIPSAAQLYLAATSATKIVQERVTTTTYQQASGVGIFSSMPEPVPGVTTIINEFASWFYKKVNQHNEQLIAEDFWPDANINLIVKRKTDADYKAAHGGANVAALLNQILEEFQLYLNPNTSEQGMWGRGNVGGLLLVLVCGTLHQRPPATHPPTIPVCDSPLGVFENLFLLAQDPFGSNWKIKTLEVILRSNPHIQQVPTIADSELAKTIRL